MLDGDRIDAMMAKARERRRGKEKEGEEQSPEPNVEQRQNRCDDGQSEREEAGKGKGRGRRAVARAQRWTGTESMIGSHSRREEEKGGEEWSDSTLSGTASRFIQKGRVL